MRGLDHPESPMPIDQKQRRHLKGLAHHLKPVVMIGQHGLSEGVTAELDVALEAHELIKVRISAADKAQRQSMIETICKRNHAEFIHAIGHVAVFYRRHPKKPKIGLS